MLITRHVPPAAAIAACLFAAACGGGGNRSEDQNDSNVAETEGARQLPIPAPEAPLDRERLLVAAIEAATAFAAGTDDSPQQKQLADRKFEFRVRFGCDGPVDQSPAIGWSFNDKSGALKVRATPALSEKDSPVASLAGAQFEAVEGFWIGKPWLLGAVCPRSPPEPAPAGDSAGGEGTATHIKPKHAAPAGQAGADSAATQEQHLVGIAQFFTSTGPRTMRRSGRAYEATKKLEAADRPKGGFDLVLTGRLAPLPDSRVIACTGSQVGERPTCVISVEFGTVSIERADTHEQLAQWGTG